MNRIDANQYAIVNGDSCTDLAQFPDESADLIVYSPPFSSLYTYSDDPRDVSNNDGHEDFFRHYGFIIDETLRLLKPGRIAAVHCMQVLMSKAMHGERGLFDFRAEIVRRHVEAGFTYRGEVTIDKCPQAQAIRTKSMDLMFVTLNKDSSKSRPALADYLLLFAKPGDNAVPVDATGEVDNDQWIEWARPIWRGIRETHVLNGKHAREEADERHLNTLQLDLIDRAVKLWSNPGETVLSPFMGIGSEGYQAITLGRKFIGCELKESYFAQAADNLATLVQTMSNPTLMDEVTA
jgi:DNA modification methylase